MTTEQASSEEVNKLQKTNEALRAALDSAAYALFVISKRMQPEAIKEFAANAHDVACAVLDSYPDETDDAGPVIQEGEVTKLGNPP